MAITNYSNLQTAVANWLGRSDLTTYIPDFITLAESRIYRELRIRAMEAALSDTIASGVIAVPSDYLEMKTLNISHANRLYNLERRDADWIYQAYPSRVSDGIPCFYAVDGSNIVFGPYPDSTYSVVGTYYKRLTALSSSSTNWFTTNAPDLLLFASLCEAEPFLVNDNRVTLWESKYQQAKTEIEREEKREHRSKHVRTMVG